MHVGWSVAERIDVYCYFLDGGADIHWATQPLGPELRTSEAFERILEPLFLKSDLNIRTALRESAVRALAKQYYLQEKFDDDVPAYGVAHASPMPQCPEEVLTMWEEGKLNAAAPDIVRSIQGAIQSLFGIEIQAPTIVFLTKVSKFGMNIFETETWQVELSRSSKPHKTEFALNGDTKNKRKADGDAVGQPTSKRPLADALVSNSNLVGGDNSLTRSVSGTKNSSHPPQSPLNDDTQEAPHNVCQQGRHSEINEDDTHISKPNGSQVSDSLKKSLVISKWLRLQLDDEACIGIVQEWIPVFFKMGYFSREEIKGMGKAARETSISPLQTRKFRKFPSFRKIEQVRGLKMGIGKMEACQCGCDGQITSWSCSVPGCACTR